ncbi:MAG: hypothetical protein ACOC0P_03395 [Planctomycetota bacterium]
MAKFTAGIGLALILLGGIMWAVSDSKSWTALFPAFFGLPVLLLGLVGMIKPRFRKHAAHAAVLITLLGAIGAGFQSLPQLTTLINDPDALDRGPLATTAQIIMFGICTVHVVVAIASFVKARQRMTNT